MNPKDNINIPTAKAKIVDAEYKEYRNGGEDKEKTQEIYSSMDYRDEKLIIAELEGREVEEFVYEYCRRHTWEDGKRPIDCDCIDTIVGLSYLGIAEVSRWYKNLQVPIEKVRREETENLVRYMVQGVNIKTNTSRIAVATQKKKMKLKGGALIDDEYVEQKALGKAQRNVLKLLIPQTVIKSWIEKYRLTHLPDIEVQRRIKAGFNYLSLTPKEQGELKEKYKDNNKALLNYLLNLQAQKSSQKTPETKEKKSNVVKSKEPSTATQISQPQVSQPQAPQTQEKETTIEDIIKEMKIEPETLEYLKTFNESAQGIKDLSEIQQQVVSHTIKQFYAFFKEGSVNREAIKHELKKIIKQRQEQEQGLTEGVFTEGAEGELFF